MRSEIDGIPVFQSIQVGDHPIQRPCSDEEFLYIPFVCYERYERGSLKSKTYYMAIAKALINESSNEVMDDGK